MVAYMPLKRRIFRSSRWVNRLQLTSTGVPSLPLQLEEDSRQEANAHDQRSHNTRAGGYTDALEH